jgi:peptidoglycan hydrolase-like protein with peptidoglycan-binding domain
MVLPAGGAGANLLALPAGATLGRYAITGVLGQGTFGITYRARDGQLGRDVAIKEYLPTAFANRHESQRVVPHSTEAAEEFAWGRQRFVEEGRALASFRHAPGIVRIHDFIEANGTAYLIMELVHGDTLEQRVAARGPLPATDIARILPPLLDGLAQVHAAGFVHRDIKPANLLLEGDGPATLVDFGAARVAVAGRTAAMTAIFTPGYAAIEQFTDARQGPWTDIFGLSATLYFGITGRMPPSAIERTVEDKCARLADLKPDGFPPALLDGLDRGMAIRPADRPQSIDAWRMLLFPPAAAAAPMPARPAPPAPTKQRPRRVAAIAALAVLALVAIAGAGWALYPRPASPDAEQAKAEQAARDRAAAEEAQRRQQAAKEAEQLLKQQEAEQAERLRKQQDAEQAERLRKQQEAEQAERVRKQQEVEQAERLRKQQDAEQAERLRKQQDAERAEQLRQQQEAEQAERLRKQQDAEQAERLRKQQEAEQAERLRKQQEAEQAERLRKQQEAEQAERLRKQQDAEQAERLRKQQDAEQAERLRKQQDAEQAERLRKQQDAEQAERLRKQQEEDSRQAGDRERKAAEAAEAALRLATLDRQRLQVALTALGFDTRGNDGVFGPRTREMVAAWQKAARLPATGYLEAAQQQRLLREAAVAVGRFDEEQKKAEDDRKKAEDEKKRREDEARKRDEEIRRPSPPPEEPPKPPPAQAGSSVKWRMRNVLIEDRSPVLCRGSGAGMYFFEIAGGTLTVSNTVGQRASAAIAADGAFAQDLQPNMGSRLRIEGNASTRSFELISANVGCRWKLVADWLKMPVPN